MAGVETAVLVCIGVVAIIAVIIFATMWHSVEPTEYGLGYNSITKKISYDHVYDGGLYFLGPFKSFIKFPRTVINMEFSDRHGARGPPIDTRTYEGLALRLHVSFQYQLIREQIPDLYKLTNIKYEETYLRQAKKIILEEASKYTAPDYWLKRGEIGQHIETQLNLTLGGTHARVTAFQMLIIDLPATYEESIVQTQVQVQLRETKRFEQNATTTRESINVDRSEADQEIAVIYAKA